jgi:PPM family protein phosphatase
MDLIIKGFTTEGKRTHNEDNFYYEPFKPNKASIKAVLVVADGMGGMAAGEVASRIAVDTFKKLIHSIKEKEKVDRIAVLDIIIKKINLKIIDESKKDPSRAGMGTTLTAVLIFDDYSYIVANVGDSRAYRITNEHVAQITEDHSAAAEALKNGTITEEELNNYQYANAITRSLGDNDELIVDIFYPFQAYEGEILLLSTDGFHKFVNDAQFATFLRGADSIEDSIKELATKAIQNSSDDNITILAVQFTENENIKDINSSYKSVVRREQKKNVVRNLFFIFSSLFIANMAFIFYSLQNNTASSSEESMAIIADAKIKGMTDNDQVSEEFYVQNENILLLKKSDLKLYMIAHPDTLSFDVSLGRKYLEDKISKGDERTPIGEYELYSFNPKGIKLGYPNREDILAGVNMNVLTQNQADSLLKKLNSEDKDNKYSFDSNLGGILIKPSDSDTKGHIGIRVKDWELFYSKLQSYKINKIVIEI